MFRQSEMCGLGVTCENFQWGWLGLYIGIDIDEDAIGPNKVGNEMWILYL